jgi:four helix bundle protein
MALVIQQKAEQAAVIIIGMTARLPGRFHSLADQAVRASTSVALNLAEGSRHIGKSKLHHYRIAYGSAEEASSAIRILQAAGQLPAQQAGTALGMLDHVRAICWKLTH